MQDPDPSSAAALAAQVMTVEEARRAEQAQRIVLPDHLLPGVGGDSTPLREALRSGGVSMLAVLTLLLVVEEFDRVAIQVLAPDIQRSLDISDTVLAGLASLGGVVLVLCTLPFAWLGDRMRRTWVLSSSTFLWAGFVAFTGLATNAFTMGIARSGAGLGASANIPISPSLISDQYPVGVRTRMLGLESMGRPIGQVIGPFAAGGIAQLIGGEDAWRVVMFFFAIPPLILAVVLLGLREPKRGRHDQAAVLGEEIEIDDPPVQLSAAFQRLKKVRTFYFLVVGIGVLGFALVAVPILMGLLFEDDPAYQYGPFTRGWIISISWAGALVAIPLAAHHGERIFRQDPTRTLRLSGVAVLLYGLFLTVGLQFEHPAPLVAFWTLANACQGAAFVTIRPAIAAVVPYRMRSQAFALVGVYIFLMGGFFGGLIGGAFSDAWGQRTALTIIVPPAALIGGLLIIHGSQYMKSDISLAVADLLEEQAELRRMAEDPEHVPMLQVHGLDVSYGPVQVLFDVDLDVQRGETLALLGTNGAGKSTLLRAVSGLLLPDRGVVRMSGRTISSVSPELRVAMGMVLVPGGEALFTSMTVRENLDIWARLIEDDDERQAARERLYETFPMIESRLDQRAGSLSGGQQQMLALGKALMVRPDVLLIDELSLGLAPVVVQELLLVIERLKAEGITMVIVEQSVNVALSVADRAVFMERGRVRFEGPAQDLLERDDLLRAVFLSGTGA